MTTDYNSKAYRRSRGAYKAQCTFEYFISILAADAFLAKLLTEIGVSDAATGVISSLVSFSFLFQFVSLTFADRLKRVKRTVMVFDTASQLLFMSIYFVPFLPGSVRFRTALITAVLLAAYFCMYVILSICYKWGNSFVEPGRRGQYSAAKEMISLASGVVFTLAVGFTVDRFEAAGNLRGAFLFLAGSMFAVCCCNFGSFLLMADRENLTGGSRKSFREMLAHTLGCRPYRNAVILACLWDAARYMTVGFLGTFKTNDLAMTVGTVQVINTAASLGRFAVSRPFGRYSDRHTYAGGFASLQMVPGGVYGAVPHEPGRHQPEQLQHDLLLHGGGLRGPRPCRQRRPAGHRGVSVVAGGQPDPQRGAAQRQPSFRCPSLRPAGPVVPVAAAHPGGHRVQ